MDNPQGQQNWLAEYNSFFIAVGEKAEKIGTALYMVTECLEDDEPMKYELRRIGLDFIEATKLLSRIGSLERGFAIDDTVLIVDHLSGLTQIAGSVSLLSTMNARILLNEFNTIKDALQAEKDRAFSLRTDGTRQGQFTLSEDILGPEFSKEIGEGLLESSGLNPYPTQMSFNKKDTSFIKKTEGGNKDLEKQKTTQTQKFDMAVKISRRDTILKLIRDKKEVMIKDITSVISDCSEKTIQRELMSLVSLGVLKKVGNKRWSRYSLV